ncbi:unnamed protein product [Bathycoccus prasinos]
MVKVCLTARVTPRAETKVGHSDPKANNSQEPLSTELFGTSMLTDHILGLKKVPRVRLFADKNGT